MLDWILRRLGLRRPLLASPARASPDGRPARPDAQEPADGSSPEADALPAFIVREAVLGADDRIAGHVFRLRDGVGEAAVDAGDSARVHRMFDRALIQQLLRLELGRLSAHRLAFVPLVADALHDPLVASLPAGVVPLVYFVGEPTDPERLAARIVELKQHRIVCGLADGRVAAAQPVVTGVVGYAFVPLPELAVPDLLDVTRTLLKLNPTIQLGARQVRSFEETDVCRRLGYRFFQGPFVIRRERWARIPVMHHAATICDILGRLRADADTDDVADAIRRDPVISYRVLRFANSAAVAAQREITSVESAVLLMGRGPLYRWLSLLLCSCKPGQRGHWAVLEQALTRGRMMELLAPGRFPASEGDAVFLAGMFSLLDVMLQTPMDVIVESVKLPGAVIDAINRRSGPYGALLRLAEACESMDQQAIGALGAELGVDAERVNAAHVEALIWANATQQDAG